jgi:tRNA A-37 threonylcarbamoyl transferase component Bud32
MAVQANVLPPRYRDPRLVARGGMGEIYRATDELLGRPVAVKVLAERYAADEAIRKRFTREALAAARLSGEPNTITIYDVGEWEGRPFIVMEYLAGGSLDAVLSSNGRPEPGQALAWLEQAGEALDRAHERGVVHRDVKPANLLLDADGNVHVADFGIATAAGLDSLTQTGTVLGTAGYLAPEQAEGRQTTAASDRYALGVVGFELLTGSRPFQSDSVTAEAAAHVHAPVPDASARAPGVPQEVDAVFRRALAKDSADRYPSSAELVRALRRAYEGRTTRVAAAPPPAARTYPARRTPWPALLALLALLALGGGIAAAVLSTRGGSDRQTLVRTVTQRGTTVHETVTAQPPPPTTTAAGPSTTTTAAAPSTGSSGAALAQDGYRRLQAGDLAGALPLLRQADAKLRGTSSIAEAYNDYNLAYVLAQTSGCSAEVLQLLDRSQQIQGKRKEIDRLRKDCKKAG